MRILFTAPYFAPAWGYGGPTRVLYELSHKLVESGHDVTVLTSNSADSMNKCYSTGETNEKGVRIIRIPVFSQKLAYRHKKFLSLQLPLYLNSLVPQNDVCQLVGSRDFFVTTSALIANYFKKPYALAVYGCLPAEGRGWKKIAKPLYDVAFTNRTVRGAGICLAQTKHEKKLYKEFGVSDHRIELVPLAVDGSRFHRLPEQGIFRARIGLSKKEKIILCVCRINALKGIDTLVKSFSQVLLQENDARLVIVGRDDGYGKEIRNLVNILGLQEKVIFAGPLYEDDILFAYVDADVFALTPPHFEETTLAGLEACFCGTQVVITEQAEIPHLEESDAGSIVPNDIELITLAVIRAIADEDTIRQRGQSAREMAYTHYDWPVVLPKFIQAYEDAIEARNGK